MSMSGKGITLLDFQNSDGKTSTLHCLCQVFLRALQAFVLRNISEGITDYSQLTSDDFDTLRIQVYNHNVLLTVPHSPSLRESALTSRLPVEDFRKTIKRDKAQYKTLKENEQWYN